MDLSQSLPQRNMNCQIRTLTFFMIWPLHVLSLVLNLLHVLLFNCFLTETQKLLHMNRRSKHHELKGDVRPSKANSYQQVHDKFTVCCKSFFCAERKESSLANTISCALLSRSVRSELWRRKSRHGEHFRRYWEWRHPFEIDRTQTNLAQNPGFQQMNGCHWVNKICRVWSNIQLKPPPAKQLVFLGDGNWMWRFIWGNKATNATSLACAWSRSEIFIIAQTWQWKYLPNSSLWWVQWHWSLVQTQQR